MNKPKVTVVAGIVIFCLSVVMLMVLNNMSLLWITDSISFVFVVVGGGALAFAKMPKSLDDFLGYFSKTVLLSGVMGAILETIAMLRGLSDPALIGPYVSTALISLLYGVAFSAVSYALSTNKTR